MKKLKIIKCSSPSSWYKPFVGMEFPVGKVGLNEVEVFENDDTSFLVKIEDCIFYESSDLTVKVKLIPNSEGDKVTAPSWFDKGDWVDLRVCEVFEVKYISSITLDTKNNNRVLSRIQHLDKVEFSNGYTKVKNELSPVKYCSFSQDATLLIRLGVAMKLPEGYEAIVVPRSSTFKSMHLIQTNSLGIIDGSFSGNGDEWCLLVYTVYPGFIMFNERICQFRIQKNQPKFNIALTDDLGTHIDRGGFGDGTKDIK